MMTRDTLSPADIVRLSRPGGQALIRAVYASAYRAARGIREKPVEEVAKSLYGDDRTTLQIISRAATAPATTTTSGWASQLSQQVVGDFVGSLAPSAAGSLIAAGMRLNISGRSSIYIPRPVTNPTALAAAWVTEGSAAPVPQFAIGGAQLGPMRKVFLMSVLTQETVNAGGEPVVAQMLRDTATATLDAAIFSNAAASGGKPAGLMAGVSALTPATGGGETAMLADLEALAGSVAAGGGSGNVAFIASPTQASAARIRLGTDRTQTIWASAALADGVVIAIDPSQFVSAFSPNVDISTSNEALLHLDDGSPAQVSTAGSPNVTAAPLRSAFQTDVLVIRCRLECAFAMRAANAVAWLTGATWG